MNVILKRIQADLTRRIADAEYSDGTWESWPLDQDTSKSDDEIEDNLKLVYGCDVNRVDLEEYRKSIGRK